ncbi:hypothetical protein D9758_002173 [Tetrapyrgos nigripes]|uniref:Fork-head domain-containing protein n=1 Tax=Tetrapyrgos nigripes TaxID=182062 RepID=A0A8H5GNM5_9AGAR|nr:hypothetical protein D9758_002173 [Tetrapyrgos nigripes]
MPHVLFLHVRYWGTVLLLNRAFIPNWRGIDFNSRESTTELKAFDLAQGAASHVSAIVNTWRERFTLKRVSPFLTSYMLNAGIMHVLTLTLRPSNVQASHGLRQCMTALKEMEILWPSASRAWDLLHGVNMAFDTPQQAPKTDRPKRAADDAFGQEKTSDYLQREAFRVSEQRDVGLQQAPSEAGVQDLSTRMMAHMLGLDIPGVEPSTSYYPGYEWWPRQGQDTVQPLTQAPPPPPPPPPQSIPPYPQDGLSTAAQMPYSNNNLGWVQGNSMGSDPQGAEEVEPPTMAKLSDLLNPVEGSRRSVDQRRPAHRRSQAGSTPEPDPEPRVEASEVPLTPTEMSDEHSATDDAMGDATPSHNDHQPHPNCPDTLACLPDTDGRPQHTLPVILRCAILGSPKQKLTIREIYAAMEGKYAYYRSAGQTWKQSVRHHLSLNRLFERQPRPVTDPGFGSYWTVNLLAPPGTKRPRKRGRKPKKDPATSPAKRRGRPRKESPSVSVKIKMSPEVDELLPYDIDPHMPMPMPQSPPYDSPSTSTSAHVLPLYHPLLLAHMRTTFGLAPYPTISSRSTFHQEPNHEALPQTLVDLDDSPESTIDKLQAEIEHLRRQSSDALQLSMRLSEQVAQAHAEANRAKSQLRAVESLLEEETCKRMEAEKAADDEARLRRKAEDAFTHFEKRWSAAQHTPERSP